MSGVPFGVDGDDFGSASEAGVVFALEVDGLDGYFFADRALFLFQHFLTTYFIFCSNY